MAIRYRTARRVIRIASGKPISPRTAQYLGRRLLMQGTGGRGRATTARPGAVPAAEEPKVIVNYKNPIVQNGKRVN